ERGPAARHPQMTSETGFWSAAAADPSRVALVDASGRRIAAGDLLASANRLVSGLRARGLEPEDAVAALLPTGLEALELYLAVAQAGWYLVPINYHSVGPEIAHILRDSEAKALVAHERFAEAAGAAVAGLGWGEERCIAVGEIPRFRPYRELKHGLPAGAPPDRRAGLVMHYTSGTTGRPKGVRRDLPDGSPEAVDWTAPLVSYGLEPPCEHVHLCCTPWYHTAPLIFISSALHAGYPVVLMDRFEPEGLLDAIEREQGTYTLMVPTQFVRLLALPEETRARADPSSLRMVIHGAAPCPTEVKRAMIAWWGPIVTEYYAATEGAATVVFADEWLRRPGTVGR